jgi:glucose-1-phosphate cytidylyltransferase
MKVVLFCGGLGTRLREHSDTIPKPLVNIGPRPILWHLMRYYAHHGHKDFVLCLGYRGDLIRQYFLNFDERMTNDFAILNLGGGVGKTRIELHSSDTDGWNITFVDTGLHSNIGQRLMRVRRHLEGQRLFLANYADGLSDLPLDKMLADFERQDAVADFVSVPANQSFHAVHSREDGLVTRFGPLPDEQVWINGGFFVFRDKIFDYLNEGEELVEEPFARLIAQRKLATYRWSGFWRCMDTFKDKITFDRMEAKGDCPWMTWKRPPDEPT